MEYELTVDVELVRSQANRAGQLTRVPQRWLDVLRKVTEPVCAASMEEQESTRIRTIHQHSGHPGVRRTLYFVRQVSLAVSKSAVRTVVRACLSIDPVPVHWKVGKLDVRDNWRRVGMDITYYEDHHYLTLIDCDPSRFSIWRPLQNQNAASIIRRLESVFSERGPPAELLTDNGAAFSGEEFGRFAENCGMHLRFRCAYVPSGNDIVDRCHRTIKRIAARTRCSIMEALSWYYVTPKDDTTATANAIYNYRVLVKSIDTAPPLEHVDSEPYNVRDAVWVKTPHGRCSMQFKKGMVTGIYSPHSVLINGIPRHIRDLRTRHRSVTSEDDGSNGSSESDSSTPLLYDTEPGNSSTKLEGAESDSDDAVNERGPLNSVTEEVRESRPILRRSSRRRRLPTPCHLCDCEIREECRREMDLPPEKRACMCLACKGKNGRSKVVF